MDRRFVHRQIALLQNKVMYFCTTSTRKLNKKITNSNLNSFRKDP